MGNTSSCGRMAHIRLLNLSLFHLFISTAYSRPNWKLSHDVVEPAWKLSHGVFEPAPDDELTIGRTYEVEWSVKTGPFARFSIAPISAPIGKYWDPSASLPRLDAVPSVLQVENPEEQKFIWNIPKELSEGYYQILIDGLESEKANSGPFFLTTSTSQTGKPTNTHQLVASTYTTEEIYVLYVNQNNFRFENIEDGPQGRTETVMTTRTLTSTTFVPAQATETSTTAITPTHNTPLEESTDSGSPRLEVIIPSIVGATLFLIILIVIGAWFIVRRRQKNNSGDSDSPPPYTVTAYPLNRYDQSRYSYTRPVSTSNVVEKIENQAGREEENVGERAYDGFSGGTEGGLGESFGERSDQRLDDRGEAGFEENSNRRTYLQGRFPI